VEDVLTTKDHIYENSSSVSEKLLDGCVHSLRWISAEVVSTFYNSVRPTDTTTKTTATATSDFSIFC